MKLLFSKAFLFCFISLFYFQSSPPQKDPKQYPKGMENPTLRGLDQLKKYPLPRYRPGHTLSYLFNWMDPFYMGEGGQPGVERDDAVKRSEFVQQELCLHWHYGIVIPNIDFAFNITGEGHCPPYVQLANEHPEIPLHFITSWLFSEPNLIGYPYTKAMVQNTDLNPAWSATFNFYGNDLKQIKFNFPDSLIRIDGAVTKYHISRLLKWLTRPVDVINEDGEEPPGPYQLPYLKKDPIMIRMKDSMKIDSWEDFMAIRKLHMRNVYAAAFMKTLPELKNTRYSLYGTEGGPINCFKWSIMKKCQTPVNGIYYSTPDFYPRWPKNWKDWSGPWHGWRWIDIGRKVEIKDGDYLFSPFVAAGWSSNPEDDIRPGQWLGLLKCLSVIGAEYYYVGYFNLGAPFTNPSQYVWQAAMPAYAQAITSRFEDVLRNGNVLFEKDGTPRITWSTEDPHVLIAVRKHNKKDKYIICGTYQPFSNDAAEIPEKRNVTIQLDGKELSFEIRRQGSVYVYEKTTDGKTLFYQLDKWHENAHPDYWSDDFNFEAEVGDSDISNAELTTVHTGAEGDYKNYTTSLNMLENKEYEYRCVIRDSVPEKRFLWIRYKGKGTLTVQSMKAKGETKRVALPDTTQWSWYKLESSFYPEGVKLCNAKGAIELDRLVISKLGVEPK